MHVLNFTINTGITFVLLTVSMTSIHAPPILKPKNSRAIEVISSSSSECSSPSSSHCTGACPSSEGWGRWRRGFPPAEVGRSRLLSSRWPRWPTRMNINGMMVRRSVCMCRRCVYVCVSAVCVCACVCMCRWCVCVCVLHVSVLP